MPSGLEEREVFDLVCKYTAHVDPELNAVAVEALIRLCKSYPEKQINLLRSFGQFLLSLPDRASELAEKSLKLFIELLGYWMKDVARVFALNDGEGSVPSRTTRLSRVDAMQAQAQHNHDPVLLWGKMQELETIGLLYLCSALPAVRGHAITLLTVAADLFERFLRKEEGSTGNYIIKVLRSFDVTLVDRFRNDYGMGTVVEQMAEKKFDEGFLLDVARSDAPAENRFWVQSFSLVIKRSFEKCPTVVHTCSEHVCQRLNFMQSSIAAAADPARFQNATLTSKFYKTTAAATDDVIDQWKFYLMYAFATEV